MITQKDITLIRTPNLNTGCGTLRACLRYEERYGIDELRIAKGSPCERAVYDDLQRRIHNTLYGDVLNDIRKIQQKYWLEANNCDIRHHTNMHSQSFIMTNIMDLVNRLSWNDAP